MSTWNAPSGELDLLRWPPREDKTLQAWDGTDTYLLEEVPEGGRVLVIGDAFGALACGLRGRDVVSWSDSELSRLATEANRARNELAGPFTFVPSTEVPEGPFDAVLARLPRGMSQLSWMLGRLELEPGTPVLLGARSKDVQKSTVAAVQTVLGPAASTLARHRSRLIRAEARGSGTPPAGRLWSTEGVRIVALPGVFGERALDRGSELLLKTTLTGGDVIDLGCGTGVLGLVVARRHRSAKVTFADSSYAAVRSAEMGWDASDLGDRARFVPGDSLATQDANSADTVLCNPPFHEGRAVHRGIAARMFADAARVLRPGGSMFVVGNRHLGYHVGLRRCFGSVQQVGGDRRFVVMRATEPLDPNAKHPDAVHPGRKRR